MALEPELQNLRLGLRRYAVGGGIIVGPVALEELGNSPELLGDDPESLYSAAPRQRSSVP